MGLDGPPFVGPTDIGSRFPDVFAKAKNGFIGPEFCFIAGAGTKHGRIVGETREAPERFTPLGK